jgi:MGT family glycosyltransferase
VRNRALRVLSDGIVFRDVVRHHDRVRKSLNLPSKRTSPMDTPLSPFLFLQGTVPEFEYPRSDLPEQVHFVGALVPAPKVRPFEAPSWWPELKERKRPVILVTQGTMDNTDLGELVRPTLRALRDANVTVVATTGRALQPGEVGEIPANAHVEEFLPYHELLPYVDVMVTNGGYNGVLAALRNGVPLIVHGAQSDKPEIGARVDWSGAGVRLRQKRVRPSDVLEAITRVLATEQYAARAKALQRNFAEHDAGTASAELLERLAETRAPVLRASSQ